MSGPPDFSLTVSPIWNIEQLYPENVRFFLNAEVMMDSSADKVCDRCHLPKPRKNFLFRTKGNDRERSYCSSCRSLVRNRHYSENKESYISGAKHRRDLVRESYFSWLSCHPCVDCGESDVVVLEPDHVRGVKHRSVGAMVSGGEPWTAILDELEKCDIRCSNCHTRKTAREQGWYKYIRAQTLVVPPPREEGPQVALCAAPGPDGSVGGRA